VANQRNRSHQYETTVGTSYHGSVKAHDKGDAHGTDGWNLAEINQESGAVQPFDFVHFGLRVFQIRTCNEAPLAVKNAEVVLLFNIYRHWFTHKDHRNSALTWYSVSGRQTPPSAFFLLIIIDPGLTACARAYLLELLVRASDWYACVPF